MLFLASVTCNQNWIIFDFSQLPDDLPFEYLLQSAATLYEKHKPDEIELEVQQMVIRE